ncbi:helix-hairpin-helix domain-containing protein [Thermosulfuriphilus ammonigenes]|uniref:Helix-hairpin-helix domain-containing protein n=1 Tax=Thermosulfuriphilus ammonigenes TaxID=1936021 RepID=A0A6G7PV37_9BACT|nr:helix-hairpin-helix domain-containing protein [Thermosulfuriphilus ammonigenes]MBA2848549.1 competence protein ComEA [Thermosulfuriphilus ammonigenes]QIJ71308.1 helix-hairpin-helix domain-containing protein [Thermosulfuriphilus ammonigenes]
MKGLRSLVVAWLFVFFLATGALAGTNLNTASAAELELLPGIGPKTAQAIVEYRKAHGPFKSIDELLKVKGIGSKKLEKIRPLVTVED